MERSKFTRNTFVKGSEERMAHMGLGNSLENLPKQLEYVSRAGKISAAIQGATVSGIALGALLTMANSKTIIELLNPEKEPGEKTR